MYLLKKIFIIFLFININSFSLSDDKVFFIDLDYLINNSKNGKNFISELETLKLQNLKDLKIEKEKVVKFENDLIKKKNILSKEEFKKKLLILENQANIYKTNKTKVSKDFDLKKSILIKKFFEQINPIIQIYMDNNSINILIDKKNVFIGNAKYDITNDILKIIDKN